MYRASQRLKSMEAKASLARALRGTVRAWRLMRRAFLGSSLAAKSSSHVLAPLAASETPFPKRCGPK